MRNNNSTQELIVDDESLTAVVGGKIHIDQDPGPGSTSLVNPVDQVALVPGIRRDPPFPRFPDPRVPGPRPIVM